MTTHAVGFRVLGDATAMRLPTNWDAAFAAYAGCDPRAKVDQEAYLSAFQFDEAFRDHFAECWSTRGFAGSCFGRFVWFDIDCEMLIDALKAAQQLATFIVDHFEIDEDLLLAWFSGSKGFHLGLPSDLWRPEPSVEFHKQTRALAEAIGEQAGVGIDSGVYDRVRIFRAPNSRHAKTGLYKRSLTFHELVTWTIDQIQRTAEQPAPFEIPKVHDASQLLADAWQQAGEHIQRVAEECRVRREVDGCSLNRSTRDFIRDGAGIGDRHRLLFSAAANLAELGCPPKLAHELLTEPALDSGLTPSEVRRQIECGLNHIK